MAHSHDESGAHVHSATDCEASGKYSEYIQSHLDALKAKCDSLNKCINRLLQGESPLLVLKGEDISLNKTCRLVYQNKDGTYRDSFDECSNMERTDIRQDIEYHLNDVIKDDKSWSKVKKCLNNKYGDNERTTMVDDLCRLASRETYMCSNYNSHRKVESFFNDQIQHLKCTCDNLNSADHDHDHSHFPLAAVVGAVSAGFIFLLIVLGLCFWCYRRRRAKKKKRSPNVIYLPAPNADNHPVYQEVFDDRPYQAHGLIMPPSSNPPTLPMRYTPHPTSKGRKDDEPAYLEPVEATGPPLPRRGMPHSNPNYDAPPEYSEHDTEKSQSEEPSYFEPLPTPPATPGKKDENGYDVPNTQMRGSEKRVPPEGYATVDEARSSVPLEEAPRPTIPLEDVVDVPLGPVPAARTKKSDSETESPYFLLEEGSMKNKQSTV